MINKRYLIILVLIFFTAIAWKTEPVEIPEVNYYASNTGSDTNDGLTLETAWASLSKAQSMTYNPGEFLNLKRGSKWDENFAVPISGEEGKPFTIRAYGKGSKPEINRLAFYRQNHHVKIQSIETNSVLNKQGVMIQSGNNIDFDNCTMNGNNQVCEAFIMMSPKGIVSHTITIKNSIVQDAGKILGYGGCVQMVGPSRDLTVENNEILNCGEYGVQAYSSDNLTIPSGLIVRNNRIIGNPLDTDQGNGINIGWYAEDCLVEDNYIENHRTGIALDGRISKPNTIRNNVIYNPIELMVLASPHGKIYDNILISGPKTVIGIWVHNSEAGQGTVLKGNTIAMLNKWQAPIRIELGYKITSDNNTFYNSNQTIFKYGDVKCPNLTWWNNFTNQDINSTVIDNATLTDSYINRVLAQHRKQ